MENTQDPTTLECRGRHCFIGSVLIAVQNDPPSRSSWTIVNEQVVICSSKWSRSAQGRRLATTSRLKPTTCDTSWRTSWRLSSPKSLADSSHIMITYPHPLIVECQSQLLRGILEGTSYRYWCTDLSCVNDQRFSDRRCTVLLESSWFWLRF